MSQRTPGRLDPFQRGGPDWLARSVSAADGHDDEGVMEVHPVAIHHVSVNVSELAAAREFYTGVLGFTERSDRPQLGVDGVWLDAGPSQVHLIVAEVPPATGQHFAIGVADLDETVAELRGQGLQVSGPHPIGPARQAFLADPDGNAIELQGV
jgi:glyoxylase I family protein